MVLERTSHIGSGDFFLVFRTTPGIPNGQMHATVCLQKRKKKEKKKVAARNQLIPAGYGYLTCPCAAMQIKPT
jgi:hypothetical protein